MSSLPYPKRWGPIEEITICLHCGCDRSIVENQMRLLEPLEQHLKIHWNNRIDRHAGSYDSYSELINDSVASSPTEVVILINDRTKPKPHEVLHLLELLQQGFAASTKYSVGFLAVTKELFRVTGWWDQRYFGAGYEDDEFVLRLRAHNIAYYESLEGEYDQHWKSPLRPAGGDRCARSEPHFYAKWRVSDWTIAQVIPEESYTQYEGKLGPTRTEISSNWLGWNKSVLGLGFHQRDTDGPSRSRWFRTREGTEFRTVVLLGQNPERATLVERVRSLEELTAPVRQAGLHVVSLDLTLGGQGDAELRGPRKVITWAEFLISATASSIDLLTIEGTPSPQSGPILSSLLPAVKAALTVNGVVIVKESDTRLLQELLPAFGVAESVILENARGERGERAFVLSRLAVDEDQQVPTSVSIPPEVPSWIVQELIVALSGTAVQGDRR